MIQIIVKSGEYYDSITLLQVAQGLSKLAGVEDAAVVMGTPANKGILKDAGMLTPEADAAFADDLIIAAKVAAKAKVDLAARVDELLKASRAPKAESGAAAAPGLCPLPRNNSPAPISRWCRSPAGMRRASLMKRSTEGCTSSSSATTSALRMKSR